MIDKVIWPLILGTGTAAGGGVAFMLPESLWSDTQVVTIYKKGNEKDDKSVLKVGGGEDRYSSWNQQNTESVVRVGPSGWQDQSVNRGATQNNSFWLAGEKHYLRGSSYWKEKMYKGEKVNSPDGALSFYLVNVTCDTLKKNENFKRDFENKEKKVQLSCKSKIDL